MVAPRRRLRRGLGPVFVVGALLTGSACSDTVSVDAPPLSGTAQRQCRALVAALPDRVADLARRPTSTDGGYGAAWGDPAIELSCGVGRPAGFDAVSQCQTANGVDWYIPDDELQGRRVDTTLTAVGRSRYVRVRIPARYLPPVDAMVDLGPALKRTLREVRPCV